MMHLLNMSLLCVMITMQRRLELAAHVHDQQPWTPLNREGKHKKTTEEPVDLTTKQQVYIRPALGMILIDC